MAELTDREMHLIRKALAIAVATFERQAGPFQSLTCQTELKSLLDKLMRSDFEMAYYVRAANIAVTGNPDCMA